MKKEIEDSNQMGFDIQQSSDNWGDHYHFMSSDNAQSKIAAAAASEGSGVRARWVELPYCDKKAKNDANPLEEGLANASSATCIEKRTHPGTKA